MSIRTLGTTKFYINGQLVLTNPKPSASPSTSATSPWSFVSTNPPYDFVKLRAQVEEIRVTVNIENVFSNACKAINKKVNTSVQSFIDDVESLRSVTDSANVDKALQVLNTYKTTPFQYKLSFPQVQEQLDRLEDYAIQRADYVRNAFCAPESIFLESGVKYANVMFNNFPDFLIGFAKKQSEHFEWRLNLLRTTNLNLIRSIPMWVDNRIRVEEFQQAFDELEHSFTRIENDYTIYIYNNNLAFDNFNGEDVANYCLKPTKKRKS